jgi:MoaA/NifB/PqqE/SkfB family radical SAM enzyme
VSTYDEITARAWDECRLLNVVLELTHLCNLDCFYCYNDRIRRRDPLTLEEYSELLQQLADMAVLNLTLTGGEPLVHPDFFAIGGRARELGFVVRIKSNGHLIRGDVAKRLREEVDPYQIEISLHGATAATHDRQTRRPGSFDRLMENVDEMRRLGLRLKLNCTLTAWNEHEAGAMLQLIDRFELPFSINTSVSPKDDGNTEPLSIAPTPEGTAELARLLDERQVSNQPDDLDIVQETGAEGSAPQVTRHCGAGSASLTIDQWGYVLPCVQWRREVGNIRQMAIAEIWSTSQGLEEVRNLTVEAKSVAARISGPTSVSFFCPGLAELRTGSPLVLYPPLASPDDD